MLRRAGVARVLTKKPVNMGWSQSQVCDFSVLAGSDKDLVASLGGE